MAYGYHGKGKRTARAKASGVNASWKDLGEVARSVRGKETLFALEHLEAAAKGEKAIEFKRHGKRRGHRKELGGKRGGFPVKSAKAVLAVVQSASANASRLGLGQTKIAHIVANKLAALPRMSPKGRRIRHDYETAFIEVVLEEMQEKAERKSAEAKKAAEGKKAQEKSQVPISGKGSASAQAPEKKEAAGTEVKKEEQKKSQ